MVTNSVNGSWSKRVWRLVQWYVLGVSVVWVALRVHAFPPSVAPLMAVALRIFVFVGPIFALIVTLARFAMARVDGPVAR